MVQVTASPRCNTNVNCNSYDHDDFNDRETTSDLTANDLHNKTEISINNISENMSTNRNNNSLGPMININKRVTKPQININVLFWNIQGIGNKLELESINKAFLQYDLIFLFETMKLNTFNPSLTNFQYVHCERKYQHPRARRPAGGIAVLIKNNVKQLITIKKVAEYVIWLGIKQKHPLPEIIIGGTYIPPAGSKVYLNTNSNDFFSTLQEDIGQFLQSSPLIALCGDLNGRTGGLNDIPPETYGKDANNLQILNLTNSDRIADPYRSSQINSVWCSKVRQSRDKMHNNYGKEIIQLCHNSNMRIINGLYNSNNTDNFTCHAPLGKSTVDYLISTESFSDVIKSFEILPKLVESDHTPLTFSIETNSCVSEYAMTNNRIKISKQTCENRRFRYVFDQHKIPEYKEALSSLQAQERLFSITEEITENKNSDAIIDSAYHFLKTGLDQTFNKKCIKAVTNTFPMNSWYDEDCKNARKTANLYAKKYDLKIDRHNNQYKMLCNEYKRIVQHKKRLHLKANRDKLLQLDSTNQTDCWRLWNNLTRGNNTNFTNTPDIHTFHEYFTAQVKPPQCTYFDYDHIEQMNKFADELKQNNSNSAMISPLAADICDGRITESEVALHIKKLKNNKASGIDGITGEFYKCITQELITPFCTIFNYIFDRGDYPSQWAEGLINALHKKGDSTNPDNYRKITITVAMAKIFDSILNSRLYFKNDALSLNDPFQFGFTPSRGTTDCVFVLDTIISYQRSKKKPTYLCFVDFTKAFDYINRNALYYKLYKQGMSHKMLAIIISMFDKAKAKVQQQGEIGPPIESLFGVLQGGILSPKLFNEYLSDLQLYINEKNGVEIEGTRFTHLSYADDIVLIAETSSALQNSINCLQKFCEKWHLIVNTAKTKVMSLGTNLAPDFTYNNEVIEQVETYKYLGTILDRRKGAYNKMIEHIASQAHKALFALRSKLKSAIGYPPPQLAIKMFDSYILPILEYNSAIWSKNTQINELEKIQIQYLKSVINVRKQTPTLAVYAETGRFPLHIRQKLATLNYWIKLRNLPNTDILNKCLKIHEHIAQRDKKSWYNKITHILSEAAIPNWDSFEPKKLASQIKLVLYDKEQNCIFKEINDTVNQPKLRTYKNFKTTYCLEPYLIMNLPKKTYVNIARFRVSSHNLRIETGRHETPKLPLTDRICPKCDANDIEDEEHCLLICKNNETHRLKLFGTVLKIIPNFKNLSKSEQFHAILASKDKYIIKALGDFLNKVM